MWERKRETMGNSNRFIVVPIRALSMVTFNGCSIVYVCVCVRYVYAHRHIHLERCNSMQSTNFVPKFIRP